MKCINKKLLASACLCLLTLSRSFSASAENNDYKPEPRGNDQAVSVNIFNYTGSILNKKSANLNYGRWGWIPENNIKVFNLSTFSSKGNTFSGPQATVVYGNLKKKVELLIYTNSDHFSPKNFNYDVCLRYEGTSGCHSKLEGYTVTADPYKGGGGSSVLHKLNVYLSENDKPLRLLCSEQKVTSNLKINGIIAMGNNISLPSSVYGGNGSIFDIPKSRDVILDILKTSYLAALKVDICHSGDTINEVFLSH